MADATPPAPPAPPANTASINAYTTQRLGDVLHLTFTLPLLTNAETLELIGATLTRQLDAQPKPNVLLDFISVRDISSALLALVATLKGTVERRGGRLKLTNLNPSLTEWFRVTRFDQLLDLYTYPHQALAAFKSSDRGV